MFHFIVRCDLWEMLNGCWSQVGILNLLSCLMPMLKNTQVFRKRCNVFVRLEEDFKTTSTIKEQKVQQMGISCNH